MKKLLLILSFIFAFAYSLLATEITVSSTTVNNWRHGGTSATLRIYTGKMFITIDAQIIMPGVGFYKDVTCTVSGTTLTIPAFTIDSTTDSSIPTVTYQAVLYDSGGRQREFYLNNFKVPHDLGSPVAWAQIITFTQSAPTPAPPGYYTNSQVNTLIAASVAGIGDRFEKDLAADYGNSLATAVSSIGATETFLNCTGVVTVSASVAVPKNIKFRPTAECAITVSSGQTLTIGTFVNPGNVKVFTSTASNAKVLFSKGAVDEINLAWWVGNTSGANITDALNEALESVNAYAGKIYIPAGQWYSSGEHSFGTGVYLRGAGNSPSYGMPNGTTVTLQSPTGTHLLKIGEAVYSTRLSDIILDGTGTSGKTGLLFEGTGGAGTTSADFRMDNVTFQNFSIGLNVNSLGSSWQFAQMLALQCIFQANDTGVRFSSVNHQWTSIGTNFAVNAYGTGIEVVAAGAVKIEGAEFATNVYSKTFTDANVNTGADTITITAHGIANNDLVYVLSSGTLPAATPAITAPMYAIVVDANTIKLSDTSGGSAIDITSASGGGTHTVYRPTAKVMTIAGSHGAITFDSVQDEAFLSFVENNASDISGIINITNGTLVQSRILLNQSARLNIDKSNIMSDVVQGASDSVATVTASHIRNESVHYGVTHGTPQLKDSASTVFVAKEELTGTGYFWNRMPTQNIVTGSGNPTVPVHGFYHDSLGVDEDKYLIQYGRAISGVPTYLYTIYRDFGNGRSVTTCNQPPYCGYDYLQGDLYAEGAVRGKSSALTNTADVYFDPKLSNYHYVTITQDITLRGVAMSADEKTRADGQSVWIEITQGTGAPWAVSTDTDIGFSSEIASISPSATAGLTDLIELKFSARKDKWLVVNVQHGY